MIESVPDSQMNPWDASNTWRWWSWLLRMGPSLPKAGGKHLQSTVYIPSTSIGYVCIWSGGRSQCAKSLPACSNSRHNAETIMAQQIFKPSSDIKRQSAQSIILQCLQGWRPAHALIFAQKRWLVALHWAAADGGVLVHRSRPSSAKHPAPNSPRHKVARHPLVAHGFTNLKMKNDESRHCLGCTYVYINNHELMVIPHVNHQQLWWKFAGP